MKSKQMKYFNIFNNFNKREIEREREKEKRNEKKYKIRIKEDKKGGERRVKNFLK